MRLEDHWYPCSASDLAGVASTRKLVNGVVILCLGLGNAGGS